MSWSRPAPLKSWGSGAHTPALAEQTSGIIGATVVVRGPDARAGGLACLASGAAALVYPSDTPQGAALALCLAGIAELKPAPYAALLGLDPAGRRIWFYHHLRPLLPAAARAFWDAQEPAIRAGLVHSGRFERACLTGQRVWGRVPGRRLARLGLAAAWARSTGVRPARTFVDVPPAEHGLGVHPHVHARIRAALASTSPPPPPTIAWLGNAVDDPDLAEQLAALPPGVRTVVGWTAQEAVPRVAGWTTDSRAVTPGPVSDRGIWLLR